MKRRLFKSVLAFILISLGISSLQAAVTNTIRVRILHARKSVTVASSGPYEIVALSGGDVLPMNGAITVKAGFGPHLSVASRTMGSEVLFSPVSPTDVMAVNGRRYRGVLIIEWLRHGSFDVVNQIALDDYLYGVLPKEVGTDWPIESLKAQAVVSRTFALANKATDPRQRFDVYNDVYSQVYGGVESESALPNQAVDATKGEILADETDKPIEAFFHSSCGGETETPDMVWPKHPVMPVYTSVSDPFCKADPFYQWRLTMSASTIRSRLRRAGIHIGEITKIKAAKKSSSGRTILFTIYSGKKSVSVAGNRFRMMMGPETLRSTLLTDIEKSGNTFRFEGHGWGHGVGLCQWGARGRAAAGQTYDQILNAYYPKARLLRLATAAS